MSFIEITTAPVKFVKCRTCGESQRGGSVAISRFKLEHECPERAA